MNLESLKYYPGKQCTCARLSNSGQNKSPPEGGLCSPSMRGLDQAELMDIALPSVGEKTDAEHAEDHHRPD